MTDELHALAGAVEAARAAWHAAWETHGWRSAEEYAAYEAYQIAIRNLMIAVNMQPKKVR